MVSDWEHLPAPAPLVGKAVNNSGELLCGLHCGRVFSWDVVLGGHFSPLIFVSLEMALPHLHGTCFPLCWWPRCPCTKSVLGFMPWQQVWSVEGAGGTAGAQSPSFLGSDVPARSRGCSDTPLGLPVSVHSTLATRVLACARHHAQLPGSLSPPARVRC